YPLFILKPFKTKEKTLLCQDENGNYWRVFNFFENTVSYDKVETTESAYEAARTFGVFSKALNNLDISNLKITIPDFHNSEKRMVYFLAAIKNGMPERIEKCKNEIDFILQQGYLFKKINQLNLPLRAVHHDTKINNV